MRVSYTPVVSLWITLHPSFTQVDTNQKLEDEEYCFVSLHLLKTVLYIYTQK